jgi:cobalamin biosynthesis Mg chelatase CobN
MRTRRLNARRLSTLIQIQAEASSNSTGKTVSPEDPEAPMWPALTAAMPELEYALIPHGLHVAGQSMSEAERREMITQDGTPDMLPTGRNIHGFDPFGIPSALR